MIKFGQALLSGIVIFGGRLSRLQFDGTRLDQILIRFLIS